MIPRAESSLAIPRIAIMAVFVALDATVFGVRLWSKKLKGARVDLGDYLLIATLILMFADIGRRASVLELFKHLRRSSSEEPDISAWRSMLEIEWFGGFTWCIQIMLIKCSILLLYRSIFFCHKKFLWAVYTVIGLCLAVFIGYLAGLLVSCKPIAYNWDKSIDGSCGFQSSYGIYVSGAVNLILDAIIVILPMPIVWKLHFPLWKKIGVTAMFGLGLMICIIVAVRIKIAADTDNAKYGFHNDILGIMSSLEIYLGFISASLPLMAPAFIRLYDRAQESPVRSFWSRVAAAGSLRGSSRSRSHSASETSPPWIYPVSPEAAYQNPSQEDGFPLKPYPEASTISLTTHSETDRSKSGPITIQVH